MNRLRFLWWFFMEVSLLVIFQKSRSQRMCLIPVILSTIGRYTLLLFRFNGIFEPKLFIPSNHTRLCLGHFLAYWGIMHALESGKTIFGSDRQGTKLGEASFALGPAARHLGEVWDQSLPDTLPPPFSGVASNFRSIQLPHLPACSEPEPGLLKGASKIFLPISSNS